MIARIWRGMTRVEHHGAYRAFKAIRAFAVNEIGRAENYAEDRDYLLEFEPTVLHSEVTGRPE